MEYYLEIKQNGLSLEIINHKELYEFSGNIPIKISKDPTYKDWGLVPYIVHNSLPELNSVVCKNGYPLKYNDETGEVILPPEAFEKSGYLFISVSVTDLSNDFHTILYTGTVRIEIPRSIRGNKILNNQSTWEDAVLSYVDTFMKNNYVPLYDELIQRASDLLNDSVTLHETVTIQQDEINNAIDEFNNIKQEVIDIKEIVATQQQNISNAINEYNEMSQDLEEKLTNGYFDGKTILYGEGVPQNDLGDVGDVYINTLNIGEHPYGLFIKEEAGWEYGWKTQGADGTDTLPILGTMFLPQEEEVPLGYEEVTEDGYFIPSNFIGSNEEDKTLDVKLNDLDREINIMQTQGVAAGDTLPIDSVFYFDGTEEELPPGYEKVETIIPPIQLLVNTDFQINQRDQSEYSLTSSSFEKIYTFDMWVIIASNTTTKLSQLDKGVRLENLGSGSSVLSQRTNIEKVSNYTVVINAKNIVGNVIVQIYYMDGGYEDHILKNDINVINVSNKSIRDISPSIRGQGSVEIEYIDLFEGDIAYPHVKEDYAIALTRCQQYVVNLGREFMGYTYNSENRIYVPTTNMLNMKSVPIIESPSSLMILINGDFIETQIISINPTTLKAAIAFNVETSVVIPKKTIFSLYLKDVENVIASCEPL